jgi:hypothetical protein
MQEVRREHEPEAFEYPKEEEEETFDRTPRRSRMKRVFLPVLAVAAVLIALGFAATAESSVSIRPRSESVSIAETFLASRSGAATTTLPVVSYELMTLTREAGKEVPATGKSFVERKASGRIVIYNKHSSSPQELIATTRFESSDGKIYRIQEGVIVPGFTVVNGETVPGSIEVTVYADAPGDSYNIDLADFTIPGFKGNPRYENFYARSKTKMAGGFSGEVTVASEADTAAAREELHQKLDAEIRAEAASQKPEGFLLYAEGISVSFESLPGVEKNGAVEIRERAVLSGVLLPKEKVAEAAAKQGTSGYDGAPVTLDGAEGLVFTLVNKEATKPASGGDFDFKLEGTSTLVWQVDTAKLAGELAGQTKEKASEIFASYPGIEEAKVIIRPFWKRTLPGEAAHVRIKLDY